jgi:transposase-like protein
MILKAAEVRLTPVDRAVLEARIRAPTTEQRDVFRARIILLAAEGQSTRSIARALGTMPRTVSSWRGRFSREGLAGLADKPHPGPKPTYDSATGRRILAALDRDPSRVRALERATDCGQVQTPKRTERPGALPARVTPVRRSSSCQVATPGSSGTPVDRAVASGAVAGGRVAGNPAATVFFGDAVVVARSEALKFVYVDEERA